MSNKIKRGKMVIQRITGWTMKFLFLLAMGISSQAFAVSTIGDIASQVVTSFSGIVKLIMGVAYIAGIAFGMSAIMKFKQHKDNPTQITVGQPVSLLLISAALVWLPALIQSTGISLFGSQGTQDFVGTASGRDIFS